METRAETREQSQVTRRRFTVHEYHRMAETGILHEDDRVELIEGEIVEMNPIGSRHAACVAALTRIMGGQSTNETLLWVQNPIRLDERREPQPDLAVIRTRDYRESLPAPEDVLLVIEVSDTTLAYDRDVKLPLYAGFGIREAWIVDLQAGVVERHTEPSPHSYRLVRRAGRGETLASEALPGMVIPVDATLG